MSRIVYFAHGLRGSLYNTTEFCHRLIADGHSVTVAAFRDVAADVHAVGADFLYLSDGPTAQAEFDATVARIGKMRAIPSGIRLQRSLARSNEVVAAVRRLDPQLLLIDTEMHAAILATRHLEIPTMAVTPFFSHGRERGMPPADTTLQPDGGLLTRLHIEWAWTRLWGRRVIERTIGQLRTRAIRQRMQPFQLNSPALPNIRRVAKAHNVKLTEEINWRQWLSPHVYTSLPMLSYTIFELDFVRHRTADFHHVGPMINDTRVEPMLGSAEHARWIDFRDRSKARGAPLIYASMGSMQPGNIEYYRHITDAVGRHPDWSLVVGLGSQSEPTELGPLPENVLVMTYAPQLEILQAASIAIHSGGLGTLNECVHHRVPSIVCSTMVVDQPGNVARIEFFGLGQAIDLADMSGASLESAIDSLLSDSATRERLTTMQAAMQRYTADNVGVTAVRDHLRQSSS